MFHERVDDGGDKLKYVSAKTTIQEPTGHLYIVQREMDVLSQEVFHILVLGRGGNKSRRRWGRTSTIQQILDKTFIKTFTLTILDLEGEAVNVIVILMITLNGHQLSKHSRIHGRC